MPQHYKTEHQKKPRNRFHFTLCIITCQILADIQAWKPEKRGKPGSVESSARFANSLALVPAAPEINAALAIPERLKGARLFAISKDSEELSDGEKGHFAILPRSRDGRLRVDPEIVSENASDEILNQIAGFDPTDAPLAFEDLSSLEREKRNYHENVLPRSYRESSGNRQGNEHPSSGVDAKERPPRLKEFASIAGQWRERFLSWLSFGF